MINLLATLDVKPQAIEQLLDLTISENKLMLAIYLAQPKVEAAGNQNDNLSVLKKQLNDNYVKITKAKDFLLSGDLDGSDYKNT